MKDILVSKTRVNTKKLKKHSLSSTPLKRTV